MNSEQDFNPNVDIRCGLCEAIIAKWTFNTHLHQHHAITTVEGRDHQKPMCKMLPDSRQRANVSNVSSQQSTVIFNMSNQGYDSDVRQLLEDKHFSEALNILNAR